MITPQTKQICTPLKLACEVRDFIHHADDQLPRGANMAGAMIGISGRFANDSTGDFGCGGATACCGSTVSGTVEMGAVVGTVAGTRAC